MKLLASGGGRNACAHCTNPAAQYALSPLSLTQPTMKSAHSLFHVFLTNALCSLAVLACSIHRIVVKRFHGLFVCLLSSLSFSTFAQADVYPQPRCRESATLHRLIGRHGCPTPIVSSLSSQKVGWHPANSHLRLHYVLLPKENGKRVAHRDVAMPASQARPVRVLVRSLSADNRY